MLFVAICLIPFDLSALLPIHERRDMILWFCMAVGWQLGNILSGHLLNEGKFSLMKSAVSANGMPRFGV